LDRDQEVAPTEWFVMLKSFRLSDLNQSRCEILRQPSSTRPTLWVVEENGSRAVIKDFSTNGFLFRNIVGRFLIWREKKAYRKLKGVKGIPRYYHVIGGLAIVLEQISGRTIEGLESEKPLGEDFFKDLQEVVESFHEHGLAHCDLKRAPNILMGDDNEPYIVDWSSSVSEREFRFFPLNVIYNRFLRDDFNAITKIKLRHIPDTVGPVERKNYYHRSKGEKLVRAMRDRLRELLQKIA
jgi:serine/threonine protein kinase